MFYWRKAYDNEKMKEEYKVTFMIDPIKHSLQQALQDLQKEAKLNNEHILVIGTSTSEVIGKHIGSAGTEDVAKVLWDVFQDFSKETSVNLAFQCCEHLNRALVIEKTVAKSRGYEIVNAVPVPNAGGSMASYAYKNMTSPFLVEEIKADAGVDIGDTFIGMHLKRVAVPVRSKVTSVGEAHLTMARTRPKLIGGERAVYLTKDSPSCH